MRAQVRLQFPKHSLAVSTICLQNRGSFGFSSAGTRSQERFGRQPAVIPNLPKSCWIFAQSQKYSCVENPPAPTEGQDCRQFQ